MHHKHIVIFFGYIDFLMILISLYGIAISLLDIFDYSSALDILNKKDIVDNKLLNIFSEALKVSRINLYKFTIIYMWFMFLLATL